MRKSLSEKDAVPPPRFGREHASLSAVEQRLFRKTASFALSSSATNFRPRISIATLPSQVLAFFLPPVDSQSPPS